MSSRFDLSSPSDLGYTPPRKEGNRVRGGGKGAGTAAPAVTLEAEPGKDPFGMDPAMRQLLLPAVRFLHDRYWRIEVSGAHHLPATGPALLLANHSGAIPFDGAMIVTAVVPVVPVAVVGAEEIYPVVGRAESVGRLVGVPYVPLTPFFPLLGLLGTIPLPTKWFIRFGKPLRLSVPEGEARPPRARAEAARVRRRVQAMVTRLTSRRQSN